MGKTLTLQSTLELLECSRCGITYAVPEDWVAARRQDHVEFRCPNGHGQVFRGETDAQKLRKVQQQLEREQRRLQSARAALTAEQDQRRAAELSGQHPEYVAEHGAVKAGDH